MDCQESSHWFGLSTPAIARVCVVTERLRTEDYARMVPGARPMVGGVFPTVLASVHGETLAVIQGVAPSYLRDAMHYAAKHLGCLQAIFMGTGGSLVGAVGDFTVAASAALIGEESISASQIEVAGWSSADLERAASKVQGVLPAEVRATVGRVATVPAVSWETRARLVNLRGQGFDLITLDTYAFFAACRAAGIAGLACQWATDTPLAGTYVWGTTHAAALPGVEAARKAAWALVPRVSMGLWEFARA